MLGASKGNSKPLCKEFPARTFLLGLVLLAGTFPRGLSKYRKQNKSNEFVLTKIGVDTTESEPSQDSRILGVRMTVQKAKNNTCTTHVGGPLGVKIPGHEVYISLQRI